MNKKKLPRYNKGGKFWEGLGNVAANTGLAVADTGLSALGASNVIKDDMYKGTTAQGFSTAGNILGGIAKAGAPMALNALAPGSGMALSAVQSGVGSAMTDPNQMPQGQYPQQSQQPQGFNPMSMMMPMMQMGMQMAPYGGQIGNPNAVKKSDSTLENIAEIFDPTGITSWDDVYRSYKQSGMSGETALEILGALPLIGKAGKAIKFAGYLGKGLKGAEYSAKSVAAYKAAQAAAIAGKTSDAIQAYTQYQDNNTKYSNGGIFNDRSLVHAPELGGYFRKRSR